MQLGKKFMQFVLGWGNVALDFFYFFQHQINIFLMRKCSEPHLLNLL
jgi:hypothetical protein